MNQGHDIHDQIISTWRYMQVGLYLDKYAQDNTDLLRQQCTNITLNDFTFEKDYIAHFIPKFEDSKSGITYFGSHVFHFSARDIFSCTYEGLSNGDRSEKVLKFQTFAKDLFGNDKLYEFKKIIELCRHIYVHNLTSSFFIKLSDIKSLCDNVRKHREDGVVSLDLDIKEFFKGCNLKTPTIKIVVDFNEISDGDSLYKIITPLEMMGLIEVCAALAQAYTDKRFHLVMTEKGIC